MKKINLICLFALVMVLMTGAAAMMGCKKDPGFPTAVTGIIAQIDAIKPVEELTMADIANVNLIRRGYKALTNANKALISNISKLDAAEAQLVIVRGIDALAPSFTSGTEMLLADSYTPVVTGYIYGKIESTVVFSVKDAGETGAVLSQGVITVNALGTFTIEVVISYSGCAITKTVDCDIAVGVPVNGTVSFASALNAVTDFTGTTVTIGSNVIKVNADGTWQSAAPYGTYTIKAESLQYVARPKEVTVSEGATNMGNLELSLYKMKDTTGMGFIDYDWENQGYKTQVRGQFNTSFTAMTVPAGEDFMFSIEVLNTTATTGDRFGATFSGAEENNGIGLLLFTHALNARFQYFNPVTSYADAHDASVGGFGGGQVAIPAGPMKLTYVRTKEGNNFRWFTIVEVGNNKYMSEVNAEGGKTALAMLNDQKITIGVGGPDKHDGTIVTWKNPTLSVGNTAADFLKYIAEVTLEKDKNDNDSTAVLSTNKILLGGSVTLTVTLKTSSSAETVYAVTAMLNGKEIILTNNGDGTLSYAVTNVTESLAFAVTVEMRQTKTISGQLSYNLKLTNSTDFTGTTVAIGSYSATVNADGSWTASVPYGTYTITASHPLYVVASKPDVVVDESAFTPVEIEFNMYIATGRGFNGYDYENRSYKVINTNSASFKGSMVSFPALTVDAGAEFAFGIQLLSTDLDAARTLRQGITVSSGDAFYLICLNKNANNGASSIRVFKNITGTNVSKDSRALASSITLPRALTDAAIKLTLVRVKDNSKYTWFITVEQGISKQVLPLTQGGVPAELEKLNNLELSFGIGGMDDRLGDTRDSNVIWKDPTLTIGEEAASDYRYTATVHLEKDADDQNSTAVLSMNSFVYGSHVLLTIVPKVQVGSVVYSITAATLNGGDISKNLVDNRDGTYTYTINYLLDYPENKLAFQIKIEKLKTFPAPIINGPKKVAYTLDHKEQVINFDITGSGNINVEIEVTNTAGDSTVKITWNSENRCLNIAAGLLKGTYTVVLTANNGSTDGAATHTLEIYVEKPYTDSALKANELAVFNSKEYLQNAANDRAWNNFTVATEMVEDLKANDGKALKVVHANAGANNYVIIYFARQDILRSQVKSVSIRIRAENLNKTGNAVWIRCGENPQQVFPASTFISGDYATLTISSIAVLNAMATNGYMTKMFIHFAGPTTNVASLYIDEITFIGDNYKNTALNGTNTLVDFSDIKSSANVVNEGRWNGVSFPVTSKNFDDSENVKGNVLKVSSTAGSGYVQIYFAQAGVLRSDVASVTITLRTEGIGNGNNINVRAGEANNAVNRVSSTSNGYITVTVTNAGTLNDMAENGVMTALGIHFTGNGTIYISSIIYTPVA